MELVGTFGRAMSGLHAGGFSTSKEAVGMAESAIAAGLIGWLSAQSQIKGKGGKLFGMPIPLGAALVAGTAGVLTRSHLLMNAARGALDAEATMVGIKKAYAPTGQTAQVLGVPHAPYQIPAHFGATPETAQLFREAGYVR